MQTLLTRLQGKLLFLGCTYPAMFASAGSAASARWWCSSSVEGQTAPHRSSPRSQWNAWVRSLTWESWGTKLKEKLVWSTKERGNEMKAYRVPVVRDHLLHKEGQLVVFLLLHSHLGVHLAVNRFHALRKRCACWIATLPAPGPFGAAAFFQS